VTLLDYRRLKGRIKERYNTQSEFAKAVNRSETYVSQVLNERTYMDQVEVDKWAKALSIPLSEYGDIFFAEEVYD
jgi:transcriptional regulator with XRE-family HTH domain